MQTASNPSNKQPKPVADTAAEPDIEDLAVKRMQSMRDAKGQKKQQDKMQALIAQAI